MALYAQKGNRQIQIDESQKTEFENKGFEVSELKDGKLISLTKKVDSKADAKLIKELEKKVEALEKENTELKAKLTEPKGEK